MKKITHYLVSMLCYTILLLTGCTSKQQPYCIGADISFVPQTKKEELPIKCRWERNGYLPNHGRPSLQHHSLVCLCQSGSPRRIRSRKGYCDLEHTLAMARRIKKAGMTFALDLHYSDTWTDPDKQFKPSAWEGTTGAELEENSTPIPKMCWLL